MTRRPVVMDYLRERVDAMVFDATKSAEMRLAQMPRPEGGETMPEPVLEPELYKGWYPAEPQKGAQTITGPDGKTVPEMPAEGEGTSPARPPIDFSPEAVAARLAWRKELHPGGGRSRWQAIENTYTISKAAAAALPGVPPNDVFGITAYDRTHDKILDHIFAKRSAFKGCSNT